MSVSATHLLEKQMEEWGYSLDGPAAETLVEYARFLAGYEAANVIGVRDVSLILRDHVLDSLSCVVAGVFSSASRLVDVGSGGGLPGVPLKITHPHLELSLVEATGKKAAFLGQVIENLSLTSTEVVNSRVEELGRDARYRGVYDVATARAVAELPVLIEYCLPLVRQGGCLVSMKAAVSPEELESGRRAANIMGGEMSGEIEVGFLPEIPEKRRRIIVVTKTAPTRPEYPRRVGLPKKRPLGQR